MSSAVADCDDVDCSEPDVATHGLRQVVAAATDKCAVDTAVVAVGIEVLRLGTVAMRSLAGQGTHIPAPMQLASVVDEEMGCMALAALVCV